MNTTNRSKVRLQVRIDSDLKLAAIEAAELVGCDLTTLVTRALCREIALAKKEYGTLWLDPESYTRFLALLDTDRPVSQDLQRIALELPQEGYFRKVRKTE